MPGHSVIIRTVPMGSIAAMAVSLRLTQHARQFCACRCPCLGNGEAGPATWAKQELVSFAVPSGQLAPRGLRGRGKRNHRLCNEEGIPLQGWGNVAQVGFEGVAQVMEHNQVAQVSLWLVVVEGAFRPSKVLAQQLQADDVGWLALSRWPSQARLGWEPSSHLVGMPRFTPLRPPGCRSR